MNLLLKKLYLEKKEFVISDLIKKYCKDLKLNYDSTVRSLLSRGYFIRIFKGIFYVKTLEEVKLNTSKYNYLELVSKGLEIKGVKNWYFGLYSALKLNNITHEYFAMEHVINDKIFRAKSINIVGYKFKFVKLKHGLLKFGIIKRNILRYSDPEKTILDFIYIWRYNGISAEKIILDISGWIENISKIKIKRYAKNYSKTTREIIEKLIK